MQASPGQEDDYTLVLPWPPGVRIARLCLFHGLFRTIRNGVCQSLRLQAGVCNIERQSWMASAGDRVRRVWSTAVCEVCTTIPQSVVDVRFRFPHRKARPKLKYK